MQLSDDPQVRTGIALGAMSAWAGTAPTCVRMMPSIAMPLHMALDSAPYVVGNGQSGDPVAFLKVYEADAAPFVDFAAVVSASRQAAELQLAPALLAAQEASGALLYAWLAPMAWRMARREDLDDEGTLCAVIEAKRSWHQSARLPVTRSPFDVIRGYLEMMERVSLPSGKPLIDLPIVRALVPWVERIRNSFLLAGYHISPIHGENALTNVMIGTGDRVQLVDFDRSVNADPHYDLASFCLEFCSFDDEIDRVVSLYLGSASTQVAARVRLYMIVDDFLWGGWAVLEHYSSERSGSVEFYKYAQNRFLRCKYWLARWDVAALLRQL